MPFQYIYRRCASARRISLTLAEYFKTRMAGHTGKQIAPLTPEVIAVLQAYHWPGNVRELEHKINHAVIVCHSSQIKVSDLGLSNSQITDADLDHKLDRDREEMSLAEFERRHILKVLKSTNDQIYGAKGAATRLGLPPSTLYSKMKKLGIKRP